MNTPYEPDTDIGLPERRLVLTYLATVGAVLILMMILGVILRMAQGEWLAIAPGWFYRIMTLHGAGMVGTAGLAGAGIMWYFLRQYAPLSLTAGWIVYGLFLLGVVLIIFGIGVGGYGGAWTFLYPLSAKPVGMWGTGGATMFLVGLLIVGVAFLLLHLDCGRAIILRYGGLGRGLGWPQLFGYNDGNAPPPAVIASTMVCIVNTLGLLGGATVILFNLIHLHFPSFEANPLLAKNLTYFFGHVFINATMYMAIIAVYHLLPRFTGRPWSSSNKAFLGAWTASTILVLLVYPHHLLMDYVNPEPLHVVLGQILSYVNGLPVLVVTAYGAITNVHRSAMRWDLSSSLLVLGTFGWAAGIIPAMIDATVVVNKVMHNTMWVPGHFHFYLLLGVFAMLLGFMIWMVRTYGAGRETGADPLYFWLYTLGGFGFVVLFLISGREGVPRRYAEHIAEWVPYDRVASVFAILVTLITLMLVIRFFLSLRRAAAAGR